MKYIRDNTKQIKNKKKREQKFAELETRDKTVAKFHSNKVLRR
jgi:hypothetical protein